MSGSSPHASHASHFAPPQDRNSSIFQPPQSPVFSSANSNSNDYFSASPRSRKRARPESVDWTATPPTNATPAQSWIQCPTPSDGVYGSAGTAASGLVNERYLLRDGFDTPGLMAGTMEAERHGEVDGRGRMRDDGAIGAGGRSERMLSGPLARERNGVARTKSSPQVPAQAQQGWTGYAFGLVGKVFSFGTGVFRGFYAGGGPGHHVHQTPAPSRAQRRPRISRAATPVPGAWQDDEFLGDFEQDNLGSPATTSASRPPNKRRQTDKDSWIMVGTPDLSDSGFSPKRKISSSSIPRSNLANRPTASRAASRRSIAPVSRRQSSYTTSTTGSPALSSQPRQRMINAAGDAPRRASFAPTRSRPSSPHEQQAYVSPEAERFAKRQAKQDRAADKAMSSMSRQLQDLIRQGQQALGTKFDVEGGGEDLEMDLDEGYVDEGDGEWR